MGSLQKFGFRIRTRNGVILDNLSVQARDRSEAERRLGQIYHYCEILECQEQAAPARPTAGTTADVEGVIALISETQELPSDRPPATAAPDEPPPSPALPGDDNT